MRAIGLGLVFFLLLVLGLTAIVMWVRKWLMPARPLTVHVRGAEPVPAVQGQTLLRALQSAGLKLPAACGGGGTCGQCRARVVQGGGEVLPTERARLSRAELKQGQRLACQLLLREDLEIQLDDALLKAEQWQCEVLQVTALAPLMREIVLQLPDALSFAFRPGSYVMVEAPSYRLAFSELQPPVEHRAIWQRLQLADLVAQSEAPVSRAYSLANVPADGGRRVVLLVRLALPPPNVIEALPGRVSSWLFARKPGDRVPVSGPFGDFAAQPGEREMVFIGGGVGMAPLRAMITDLLQTQHSQRRISFWYGARSQIELFYREQFDALAAEYGNFRWTVALSDPAAGDDWDGARGFIHEVLCQRYLRQHPAPEECEYYLCGPPLMIKAVLAMLDQLGVEPERIFNDDFGSR
ncbi:NADH:ubiquinone reductase (Na(+)-transporting) subunit F [Pseudomarimonas arenosa]|uniref:Na(+)-translocating NADH-quinone reductase subunit F n=1 Tax=Pseudomarimonas arenosa TaxID=2774145 RepID=A0AAW3ZMI7_9GAMM|nr:NADH:ubiquinone reductase (Na(+)-transporting) subunit F [Pseudomarimonas arenosa]MBD8526120.1 NADH:ubiquinone reductase (Na(+)-transporting) subunit F [Pseudomarimonas arenosa]